MREGWPLSLLLIDLDHFKRFNDRYGHHPGDECLRVVAPVLKTTVRRGGDVAARYGGEEMALILPATAEAGAGGVAAQVLAAVRALGIRHEQNPEGGGCVTVSVGAATVVFRGGSRPAQLQDLVVAADQALYFAKREGRNRVSAVTIAAQRE